MSSSLKRFTLLILKLFFTFLGLYFAFGKVDIRDANIDLNTNQFFLFLFASFITFLGFLFTSVRLKVLLKDIPFSIANRVTFIGIFFNMILPSSIGGDLVRIYEIDKYVKDYKRSSVIVIIDRIIGLTGLAVISFIGLSLLILVGEKSLNRLIIFMVIGSVLFLILFWVLLYLFIKLGKKYDSINVNNQYIQRFVKGILKISEIIPTISIRSIYLSFLFSLLTHLFSALAFMIVISYMYNGNISLLISLTVNSLINLLLILPISIGGIGVRDYLFTLFIPSIQESGYFILIGTSIFLLSFPSALYGSILFLRNKKKYENDLSISK